MTAAGATAKPAAAKPAAAKPATGKPSIWAVVTCMGRRQFLQKTAPSVLAERELKYCLVDYSCPEGSGAWFRDHFARAVAEGRAAVVHESQKTRFEKSRALNLGARLALERGADYLCFLDVDTLVKPGFGWVAAGLAGPDRFLVAGQRHDKTDVGCLMGFVLMPAAVFVRTGGFDEGMVGWGGEDVEMRLRLHLKEGLSYKRLPLDLLDFIDHGNELRDRYHSVPFAVAGRRNLQRALARVTEWTGRRNLRPRSGGAGLDLLAAAPASRAPPPAPRGAANMNGHHESATPNPVRRPVRNPVRSPVGPGDNRRPGG